MRKDNSDFGNLLAQGDGKSSQTVISSIVGTIVVVESVA